MPLAVGVLALVFIAMALLTLLTLYWILTQWNNFVQNIPVVGGALGNVATYLRDRNEELIRTVFGFAHAVISWSADRVNDAFHALHDIWNAGVIASVTQLLAHMVAAERWIALVGTVAIAQFNAQFAYLNQWKNTFVDLNIQAFAFWKGQTISLLNNYVLPNIASLVIATSAITQITIPSLRNQIQALTAETLAWIDGVVKPMRIELSNLQQTLTAVLYDPIRGVIPRVGKAEGTIAQILPWAATIGLTIPIARTLARVGRNPCTCLEDQGGQTDMLPLLMYLFEEAG